jgi:hypothetical protein
MNTGAGACPPFPSPKGAAAANLAARKEKKMKFKIDNVVLDTDKAIGMWNEDTMFDGHNHISVATGRQWYHQTLYRSRKGRYYLVHTSDWQGSSSSAEFVSDREAAQWLLHNDHPLPEDLQPLEDAISE